jgi:hypothetical protein
VKKSAAAPVPAAPELPGDSKHLAELIADRDDLDPDTIRNMVRGVAEKVPDASEREIVSAVAALLPARPLERWGATHPDSVARLPASPRDGEEWALFERIFRKANTWLVKRYWMGHLTAGALADLVTDALLAHPGVDEQIVAEDVIRRHPPRDPDLAHLWAYEISKWPKPERPLDEDEGPPPPPPELPRPGQRWPWFDPIEAEVAEGLEDLAIQAEAEVVLTISRAWKASGNGGLPPVRFVRHGIAEARSQRPRLGPDDDLDRITGRGRWRDLGGSRPDTYGHTDRVVGIATMRKR